MQYFGVPRCPYCKKRVNLIRTWSLKRQGEYRCPRCGGISNIFLSPLIYVFALLAVFAGGAVYFFHKFVLNDISLSTVAQVLIPFAVFFLLSLFMVYLAKPVIKKVSKAELGRKKRKERNLENRRRPAQETGERMFYDSEEYLPQMDYRTGPLPQTEDDRDMKILPPAPHRQEAREELQKTSVVDVKPFRQGGKPDPAPRPSKPAQPVSRPVSQREQPSRTRTAPSVTSAPVVSSPPRTPAARTAPTARRITVENVLPAAKVTSSGSGAPVLSNEDFFAKYDDPSYVERRLREMKEGRGGND